MARSVRRIGRAGFASLIALTSCGENDRKAETRTRDLPVQSSIRGKNSTADRAPSERGNSRTRTPDPAAGVALAEPEPATTSEDDSDTIPDEVLHEWLQRAGNDPRATLREALIVENPLLRATLAEWILNAWTTDDRIEALEWAENYLNEPSPAGVGLVLGNLLPPWAVDSPLDALAWVRRVLPRSLVARGEAEVAAAWAASSPSRLAEWLDARQPNEVDPFWWEELVHGLTTEDPAEAFERAGMLNSTTAADELRNAVLRSWLLNDSEGLDDWLESRPEYRSEVAAIRAETDISRFPE